MRYHQSRSFTLSYFTNKSPFFKCPQYSAMHLCSIRFFHWDSRSRLQKNHERTGWDDITRQALSLRCMSSTHYRWTYSLKARKDVESRGRKLPSNLKCYAAKVVGWRDFTCCTSLRSREMYQ